MLGNAAADHFPVFNNHRHPAFKTGDQPRHALVNDRLFFTGVQRCQGADKRREISSFQRIGDV